MEKKELNINNKILYEHAPDQIDTFKWKKHKHGSYHTHFHSAVELCLVEEGAIEVEINRKIYHAEKGDILMVNPFEVHTYYNIGDAYTAGFIFSQNYLSDFKKIYGEKIIPNFLNDKEYNQRVFEPLKDITPSLNNNDSISSIAKHGIVDLVLDKIISRYGVIETKQTNDEIIDILKYIYNNYHQEITLDVLAKKFNYAKTSISRLISKYLHTDLRCFVNNLRVEQAENLLNSSNYTNYSILQIAYMCGFDSPATFYRAYKKRYNHLPRKHDSQ